MYSDTNTTRSVADAVMKIMNEKLHPNQQKLDVHEPEKDELTAKDFEMLRAGKKAKEVKKEEVEQIEESDLGNGYKIKMKHSDKGRIHSPSGEHVADVTRHESGWQYHSGGKNWDGSETSKHYKTGVEKNKMAAAKKAAQIHMNEEVEPILEYETDKNGRYVHNAKAGKYGGSEKPQDPFAGVRGPGQKDLEKIEAEKKKKKKFSEMIDLYNEKGLKSLSEMLVKEEPDNEQFTKELEDAKAKSEGKKPNKEIAKGSVQAVKSEEVETELEVIEEREMTSAEMEKRETIVKSMKKGMAGFKERYGDRAKNVMYATATKQAMKEETESEHYKAGHEYASDHAQDAGFKVTARARKKEMLADNPHKKGTPEHSDWHRGANDGHQTALDNM